MKKQTIYIIAISILILILVYSPHFSNPYPLHIDEYKHITSSIKLQQGNYNFKSLEFGFHLILLPLTTLTNIVLIYKFLPAIWAVFSALVLFFVVKKKTNNPTIAILAILFFASIKSNVNFLGLWFFTPLSFSIPFIFLYIYFFTEGLEKQNKKYILISLAIILSLLTIHAVAVLFALPFLIIYTLIHHNYLKKEIKFFSLLLLVPLAGLIFYKLIKNTSLTNLLPQIFNLLQFKHGWGVLELKNSFLEIYSLTGYILAIIGTAVILLYNRTKKYLIYLIWPATILLSILIFRLTNTSYLVPYQRNLYYLAISLPFLSAIGTYYLFKLIKAEIEKSNLGDKIKTQIKKYLPILLILILILFLFYSYFTVPKNLELYQLIDEKDYQDLLFVKTLTTTPYQRIMADIFVSTALYPITQKKAVGTIFFYGNRTAVESFFSPTDCETKNQLIEKHKVRYVISKFPINCGWEIIYNRYNLIYEVK